MSKYHQVFNKRTNKLEWSEYPQTKPDAIEQKSRYYQPIGEDPCPTCGMYSVRYTVSELCKLCSNHAAVASYREAMTEGEPTSFEEAREQGLNYYWKGAENKLCGHNGKVTLTGKCFTCANGTNQRPTPIQEQFPDMILQYEEAKALKFKVYRTGEPCNNSHCGWRYVSNRGCIDCKNGS
jgi:hypothetical protein